MSTSIELLQQKAIDERRQLHRTALELREKLHGTRENLRLSKQLREHLAAVSVLAGLVGLVLGYGFAGVFRRL